jgi:hypothetical protein
MARDIEEPVNLGSDELVAIDQLIDLMEGLAGVQLRRRYVLDAPKGVNGRNSDNSRLRRYLGWEPTIPLREGMARTYPWILREYQARKQRGAAPTRRLEFPRVHPNTVLTLLDRLEAKGHARVDRGRRTYIFPPSSLRDGDLIANHLKSGLDQFRTLGPDLPGLARAVTRVLSPAEIAALRVQINRMFEDDDGS